MTIAHVETPATQPTAIGTVSVLGYENGAPVIARWNA